MTKSMEPITSPETLLQAIFLKLGTLDLSKDHCLQDIRDLIADNSTHFNKKFIFLFRTSINYILNQGDYDEVAKKGFGIQLAIFSDLLSIFLFDDENYSAASLLASLAAKQLCKNTPGLSSTIDEGIGHGLIARAFFGEEQASEAAVEHYRSALSADAIEPGELERVRRRIIDHLSNWTERSGTATPSRIMNELFPETTLYGRSDELPIGRLSDELDRINALMNVHEGIPQEVAEHCDQHLKFLAKECEARKDSKLQINVLLVHGSVKIKRAMVSRNEAERNQFLTDAIDVLSSAITLAANIRDMESMADGQVNLADAYGQLESGDRAEYLRRAFSLNERALDYYDRNKIRRKEMIVHGNIGHLYLRNPKILDYWDRAYEHFQNAFHLADHLNEPGQISAYAFCLARCHLEKPQETSTEDKQKAISIIKILIENYSLKENRQRFFEAMQCFGQTFIDLEEISYASGLYAEAIEMLWNMRLETKDITRLAHVSDYTIHFVAKIVDILLSDQKVMKALYYIYFSQHILSLERLYSVRTAPGLRTIFKSQATILNCQQSLEKIGSIEGVPDSFSVSKSEAWRKEYGYFKGLTTNLKREIQQNRAVIESGPLLIQFFSDGWREALFDDVLSQIRRQNFVFLQVFTASKDHSYLIAIWPNGTIKWKRLDPSFIQNVCEIFFSQSGGYFSDMPSLWRAQLDQNIVRVSSDLGIEDLLPRDIYDQSYGLLINNSTISQYIPFPAISVGSRKLIDVFDLGIRYGQNLPLEDTENTEFVDQQRNVGLVIGDLQDLSCSDFEVRLAEKYAVANGWNVVLIGHDNIEELEQCHVIIFFGHGYLGFINAGIKMENGPDLTQKQLMQLDLSKCRILIASNCESGLTDNMHDSGDNLCLADSMIFAGAYSVLASQWTNSDEVMLLINARLFEFIFANDRTDIAVLTKYLRDVQMWIKSLEAGEFRTWIKSAFSPIEYNELGKIFPWLTACPESIQPFEDPYYWSGMSVR